MMRQMALLTAVLAAGALSARAQGLADGGGLDLPGIVLTLAHDVVGTGPRLQMLTEDPEAGARIEGEFARWSQAVGLAGDRRTYANVTRPVAD